MEYDCFQIELAKNYGTAEWREDLRNVMIKAGLENKPMVFLFSDTQVRLLMLVKEHIHRIQNTQSLLSRNNWEIYAGQVTHSQNTEYTIFIV